MDSSDQLDNSNYQPTAGDETPPWQPLFIRLNNINRYIKQHPTQGKPLVFWENDPYLRLARQLVRRATSACQQGAFLARKMDDLQRRLNMAQTEKQYEFYQPLWNEMVTYQGVANMYGNYFADITCSADDVLTLLERQIFTLTAV